LARRLTMALLVDGMGFECASNTEDQ
jgi:hypothetical protein